MTKAHTLCNGCYSPHFWNKCSNERIDRLTYVAKFMDSNPDFPTNLYGKYRVNAITPSFIMNYKFWYCLRMLLNKHCKKKQVNKRTGRIENFVKKLFNWLWRTLWAYPDGGYTIVLTILWGSEYHQKIRRSSNFKKWLNNSVNIW